MCSPLPAPRGIWYTLVRAHFWRTFAGVVVAGLLFALLMALEVAFVVQDPRASAASLVVFCAIGGALLGGLVTIRPNHMPYIARVRAALDSGRHVLVVQATDSEQANAAKDCLERYADETMTTFGWCLVGSASGWQAAGAARSFPTRQQPAGNRPHAACLCSNQSSVPPS